MNFPVPNGNLGVKYRLEDWAHPSYFPEDKGVYLISVSPYVQGAVQTSEIIPDARQLPNKDISRKEICI